MAPEKVKVTAPVRVTSKTFPSASFSVTLTRRRVNGRQLVLAAARGLERAEGSQQTGSAPCVLARCSLRQSCAGTLRWRGMEVHLGSTTRRGGRLADEHGALVAPATATAQI